MISSTVIYLTIIIFILTLLGWIILRDPHFLPKIFRNLFKRDKKKFDNPNKGNNYF